MLYAFFLFGPSFSHFLLFQEPAFLEENLHGQFGPHVPALEYFAVAGVEGGGGGCIENQGKKASDIPASRKQSRANGLQGFHFLLMHTQAFPQRVLQKHNTMRRAWGFFVFCFPQTTFKPNFHFSSHLQKPPVAPSIPRGGGKASGIGGKAARACGARFGQKRAVLLF